MSISDWKRYIASLDLSVPKDRGALWSKLDPNKGPIVAKELAREMQKITLEMKLETTDFMRRYAQQFKDHNDTTIAIWHDVSRRFVSGLRGTVTAFVDRPVLFAAMKNKQISPPVFATELWDLIDIMRSNNLVTGMVVFDVNLRDDFTITREMVSGAVH